MPEPPPVTRAAFPDQSNMLEACAAKILYFLGMVSQYSTIP